MTLICKVAGGEAGGAGGEVGGVVGSEGCAGGDGGERGAGGDEGGMGGASGAVKASDRLRLLVDPSISFAKEHPSISTLPPSTRMLTPGHIAISTTCNGGAPALTVSSGASPGGGLSTAPGVPIIQISLDTAPESRTMGVGLRYVPLMAMLSGNPAALDVARAAARPRPSDETASERWGGGGEGGGGSAGGLGLSGGGVSGG